MITVSGLTKKYGARTVVDDVSFTLEPGTVTGFLGPNGAGKTTTISILCTLVRKTAGGLRAAAFWWSAVASEPSTPKPIRSATAGRCRWCLPGKGPMSRWPT